MDLYYVQIEEVVKKAAIGLHKEFEEKRNRLHLPTISNLPPIIGDSLRLEQIFINILHNANKFTEKGDIDVTYEVKDDNFLIVTVTDNGIGIPSHDLKRIWDRFFKVDRVRTKQGRGTGLGLAIVKELVHLHHGEITAKSILGEGTSFIIRFPLQLNSSRIKVN